MIFRNRLVALGVFATLLAPVFSLMIEQSCDARGGRGGGMKQGGCGMKRGGNFGGGRGLSRRGGRGGYRNQDLNGDGVVDLSTHTAVATGAAHVRTPGASATCH